MDIDKIRFFINEIDNYDLKNVEFYKVWWHVNLLLSELNQQIIKLPLGTPLLRASKRFKERPVDVSELGAPPVEKVVGFQRCNQPGKPMFYCSSHVATALREIVVEPGDRVYVSECSVRELFDLFRMPPLRGLAKDVEAFDVLAAWIDKRFTEKIDKAFSERYKVTAALTACYASGTIDRFNLSNLPMGGVAYQSVAHGEKYRINFAIHANIAKQCVGFDRVTELEIYEVSDSKITFFVHGVAEKIIDGKIIWGDRQWQSVDQPVSFNEV